MACELQLINLVDHFCVVTYCGLVTPYGDIDQHQLDSDKNENGCTSMLTNQYHPDRNSKIQGFWSWIYQIFIQHLQVHKDANSIQWTSIDNVGFMVMNICAEISRNVVIIYSRVDSKFVGIFQGLVISNTEKWELSWNQLCGLQVVAMITFGGPIDNKVGTMMTQDF